MIHFMCWLCRPRPMPAAGPFFWQVLNKTELAAGTRVWSSPLLAPLGPHFPTSYSSLLKSSLWSPAGTQPTSVLMASLQVLSYRREPESVLSHLSDHTTRRWPSHQAQVEEWSVSRGAPVLQAGDSLQGVQCPSCPPLSINCPLACGSGVASNGLIYVTVVLLTN